MKTILFTLCLALGTLAHAQSAQSILEKHMGAMLTDLNAYIEANPDAADLLDAIQSAVQAAFVTDQSEEVVRLLDLQFKALTAMDMPPEQETIQTGMMLAQFALQNGNSDAAKSVQDAFEVLAKKNPDAAYGQVGASLQAMLSKPSIGVSPELSGTTLDGDKISLEDYKGKVVLLDFWATWCGPCVRKMPEVKAVYDKYNKDGFDIIGISLDRSVDPLKEFIAENGLGWKNIFDGDQDQSLADQFGITSIPSLFLLNQEGTIVALDPHGGDLDGEVAKLLGK